MCGRYVRIRSEGLPIRAVDATARQRIIRRSATGCGSLRQAFTTVVRGGLPGYLSELLFSGTPNSAERRLRAASIVL